ncbi:TPA: winged helix-turn-helix transcriptional regulator [Candidatus Bathyarchaeota archaeon]|nr:winged helix-turn-helix transcriptional regulator [Candidatus Bathyarchaeota archaeon]
MISSQFEEDIIYVMASVNRKKILRHLQKETEYISTSDLANAIGVKRGRINPHCRGLAERGLIDRRSDKGCQRDADENHREGDQGNRRSQ